MRKERPTVTQPASKRPGERADTAPRRLPPEMRAELILDEALRLYAERHYSIVTMRDIAEACGINVALIYYYFDGKDVLFRRTIAHVAERIHGQFLEQRLEAPDPLLEIGAYLSLQAKMAPMVASWVKIMADYAASSARDAETDAIIADFYAREQALLEDCITRGIHSGQFRPVDVAKAARLISIHLDGIFHATTSRADHRLVEDIEELCALATTLLRVRGEAETSGGPVLP